MTRFLETISIKNGVAQNLSWHQRRVAATLSHFYPGDEAAQHIFQLDEILASCSIPGPGHFRCRIEYGLNALSVEFIPYTLKGIRTLRLLEVPEGFDYRYKYADRKILEGLFENRNNSDDILMTRTGWITDTSIANVAFSKNDRWYTPSFPLLAGTAWKRLISSGEIIPRPIHQDDLKYFDTCRIFNALIGFEEMEIPTAAITRL